MERDREIGNAFSLLGETFLPGASQYLAGNVGSGIVHSLLAMSAGALLVGSGAAPVIGALAVLGIKLNSYSSAITGRNLWDLGTDVVNRPGNLPGTPPTPSIAGPQDGRETAEAQANLAPLVPPPSPDAARIQALGGQSGGTRSQPQTSGTTQSLRAVRFAADGRRGWVVGTGGTILTTEDGGARWQPQTSGTTQALRAIQFAADAGFTHKRSKVECYARSGNLRAASALR